MCNNSHCISNNLATISVWSLYHSMYVKMDDMAAPPKSEAKSPPGGPLVASRMFADGTEFKLFISHWCMCSQFRQKQNGATRVRDILNSTTRGIRDTSSIFIHSLWFKLICSWLALFVFLSPVLWVLLKMSTQTHSPEGFHWIENFVSSKHSNVSRI